MIWTQKLTGCFVSMIPDRKTKEALANLVRTIPVFKPKLADKMHCTLIHSLTSSSEIIPKPHCDIVVEHSKLEIWELQDKGLGVKHALVLTFESKDLEARKDELEKHGVKCQYDVFRPHLTLSMDVPKNLKVKDIEFNTPLRFVREIICECDGGSLL